MHFGVCQCRNSFKAVLILAKSKEHCNVLTYPSLMDTKMHAHGVRGLNPLDF